MLVSNQDIAAYCNEAGIAYPTTAEEKANVSFAAATWKKEQLREIKGQQPSPAQAASVLALAGAGALGVGGLGLYLHQNHRNQHAQAAADSSRSASAQTAQAPPGATAAQAAAVARATQATPAPVAQAASATSAAPATRAAPVVQSPPVNPSPAGPGARRLPAPGSPGALALIARVVNAPSLPLDTTPRPTPDLSRATAFLPDTSNGPIFKYGYQKTFDNRNPQVPTRSLSGGSLARQKGFDQYKSRTNSGFHGDLARLQTPGDRLRLYSEVADQGTPYAAIKTAQALDALEGFNDPNSRPVLSYLSGLTSEQLYGTLSPREAAQFGESVGFATRTKANSSSQYGYEAASERPSYEADKKIGGSGEYALLLRALAAEGPGDRGASLANLSYSAPGSVFAKPGALDAYIKGLRPNTDTQTNIDKNRASTFFPEPGASAEVYLGTDKIKVGKETIYSGLKADGSPIKLSDISYHPTDDPSFYERQRRWDHPTLSERKIRANYGNKPDLRYADKEDAVIKNLQEPLPASDPRFTRPQESGIGDNIVFGRLQKGGDIVPLDLSGFQSEAQSPAFRAAGQLFAEHDAYAALNQASMPDSLYQGRALELAREYSTDLESMNRAAEAISARKSPDSARATGTAAPADAPNPALRGKYKNPRALRAGSGDALGRIYRSLGSHSGLNPLSLEAAIRSGDAHLANNLLAQEIPSYVAEIGKHLNGLSLDEKVGVIGEAVSAGIHDLAHALEHYPQESAAFGAGRGPGAFGVDAYLKSYVRDYAVTRGLAADPTGVATYHVPNDAFDLLAFKGYLDKRGTLAAIDDQIRGARHPLEGALRLDRLVSSVRSTKEGDPNSNATRFAQFVFDHPDRALASTTLTESSPSQVNLMFATRLGSDPTSGFLNHNPDRSSIQELIDNQLDNPGGNSTLNALVSGSNFNTPEGRSYRAAARDAMGWLERNAAKIEDRKAGLNRGVDFRRGPDGELREVSIGRGLAIAAAEQGAFLARNTEGAAAPFTEDVGSHDFAVGDDQVEDRARNAQIEKGVAANDGAFTGPLQSEADLVARQYNRNRLNTHALGVGSHGAMADGEAAEALERTRRYLGELEAVRSQALAEQAQSPAQASISRNILSYVDSLKAARDQMPAWRRRR